jgi:hypothetical protein
LQTSRPRVFLAVAVAILIVTGLSSGRAVGYDVGYFIADGVNIRSEPYLNPANIIGLGYVGQDTCQYWIVVGDYANGNPYWWYHHRSNPATSLAYSHVAYIATYGPYISCT